MTWALVVAPKGGQRSLAARELADALAARGLAVGGFVQRTAEPVPGRKEITLVRLRDGRERLLARTVVGAPAAAPPAAADASACSLAFEPAAFEAARAWVEEDAGTSQVLVLDALGKLELSGEGHRAAVARALASDRPVVLAVRDDQLVYAVEALGLDEPVAAFTDGEGAAALAAFLDAVEGAARRP
jgi:nucleoside-triphosphatase THEP1